MKAVSGKHEERQAHAREDFAALDFAEDVGPEKRHQMAAMVKRTARKTKGEE